MKPFKLTIWDGYSNTSRIVWADSYDQAIRKFTNHLPPSYIWSIEPK